jgi:hypothetical protein
VLVGFTIKTNWGLCFIRVAKTFKFPKAKVISYIYLSSSCSLMRTGNSASMARALSLA